ncbi:hypothetical protein SAMN04488056_106105 [Cohaesibacter marisflavi]|uniref:Uncharacterized protein n=1 Tax=Cohaesibacter marisflavi TaxID=655353 RepID=A0A1I5H9H4_9HYPH|nr:hypothetical protein SAMN04488056_106105 [Cohaesibacter marisflavi]
MTSDHRPGVPTALDARIRALALQIGRHRRQIVRPDRLTECLATG